FHNGCKWGLALESGDFLFHDVSHGLFDVVNTNSLNDFVAETTHDQFASKRLWATPSYSVERLVLIKASNRRGVSTGVNNEGLDFEVWNRVCLGTFRQQ